MPDPDGDPIQSYFSIATAPPSPTGSTRSPPPTRRSSTLGRMVLCTTTGSRPSTTTSPSPPHRAGDRTSRLRERGRVHAPELLVGALLMIIVMSASLGVLDNLSRLGSAADARVELQDRARQASRKLARSLRNVGAVTGVSDRHRARRRVRPRLPHGRPAARRRRAANTRNLRACALLPRREQPGPRQLLEQTPALEHADGADHAGRTACPAAAWGPSRLVADYLTNRSGGTDRALWTYSQTATGEITAVKVNLF